MEILITPSTFLNQKVKAVKKIDQPILQLIEEMKQTLLQTVDPKGVGLAAPQVSKSLRIFILKPRENSPFSVFINPEITWLSEEKTNGVPQRQNKYEGCLSIPGIWGMVHRAKTLCLSYQTPDEKHHERQFKGFMTTIIQHEMDHLNGILFTQRVLEQKEKLYKLVKNKKGKEVFEPLEI